MKKFFENSFLVLKNLLDHHNPQVISMSAKIFINFITKENELILKEILPKIKKLVEHGNKNVRDSATSLLA